MLFLAVFVVFLTLLYIYVTRNSNYWKKRGVPYIKPIPIIGNLYKVLLLRRSIGDALHEIYKATNDDYVGFFVFSEPTLLIRDPLIISQIMTTDFEYFRDREITVSKHDPISSNMLFLLKTPLWNAVRQKITPIFRSNKIKGMVPLVTEVSEELKLYVENVDMKSKFGDSREMFMKYVSDVISSCVFGVPDHSLNDERCPFYVAATRCFEYHIIRSFSMYAFFIAPTLVRLFRLSFVESSAASFWSNTFWKQINDREANGLCRGDLIDLLLELKKSKESQGLSDRLIASQAVQFYFAGFDTTSTTLALTMFSIAQHQDVQQKLRQEIKHITETHGGITYEAINDAKYLNAVISETLRIYPILPFLSRKCNKRYEIPGTSAVIEEGITVYFSLFGLHYDPQYFPEPYKFDPERFSEDNKSSIVRGTYLPFGDGPRNCIGVRFAQMVIKTAIIHLLSEFEVQTDVEASERLEFDPKGLMISPTSEQLRLRFTKYVH